MKIGTGALVLPLALLCASCASERLPHGGRTVDGGHVTFAPDGGEVPLESIVKMFEQAEGVTIRYASDDLRDKQVFVKDEHGEWPGLLIKCLGRHDLELWHHVGTTIYEVKRKK